MNILRTLSTLHVSQMIISTYFTNSHLTCAAFRKLKNWQRVLDSHESEAAQLDGSTDERAR